MGELSALEARLAARGEDFEWLQAPVAAAPSVRIRAIGPFQGNPVIWEARIMTLAHWQATCPEAAGVSPRQFIEIHPAQGEARSVDIALAVPVIDRPVIIKSLIMLRQYKRLAEGRHVFGPQWTGMSAIPDTPSPD